jgi:hypothetical protein
VRLLLPLDVLLLGCQQQCHKVLPALPALPRAAAGPLGACFQGLSLNLLLLPPAAAGPLGACFQGLCLSLGESSGQWDPQTGCVGGAAALGQLLVQTLGEPQEQMAGARC